MSAVPTQVFQLYLLELHKMEQSINLFLDNSNLTNLNSLIHLLDFDDNYNDLAKSIQPSKYYSEDVFMEKSDSNSCIIMSLNCQSLHAKFSQIKLLVDTFSENGTPIQVLCLQETWFENSDNIDLGLYHIDNYHFVTKNRYATAHGGLAYYIHSTSNYKVKQIQLIPLSGKKCILKYMIPPIPSANSQLVTCIDHRTQPLFS